MIGLFSSREELAAVSLRPHSPPQGTQQALCPWSPRENVFSTSQVLVCDCLGSPTEPPAGREACPLSTHPLALGSRMHDFFPISSRPRSRELGAHLVEVDSSAFLVCGLVSSLPNLVCITS